MKKDKWYDKIKNPLAKSWFQMAEEELLFAKAGFQETENWRMVCFCCQQVTEKYLKGYLQLKRIKFPKTHNLIELLELASKASKNLKELREPCKVLDKYYIATRYPNGDWEEYKKSDAKEALELSKEIMEFIERKI